MNPATTEQATLQRSSRRGDPTWEIARLYPRQGEWTEEDFLALSTRLPVELSNGCLEFLPMPSFYHQLVVAWLYDTLKAYLEVSLIGGKVVFAPLPVRLWPGQFREPDIIYLSAQRVRTVQRQPEGADLVMEVVSEGSENRERDLQTKREEYAQARIAEYWIIDPQERRIIVLTLDGQTYREHGTFLPGSQATSVLLTGFSVAVDAVFAAGEYMSS